MSQITCCPHCSGTSGFSYEMSVTYHMVGLWGEPAEAGDSNLTKCGLAKCMDCGSKVRHTTAEGAQAAQKGTQ